MAVIGMWANIAAWLIGNVEDQVLALLTRELARRGIRGSSNVISTRVTGYVGSTRAMRETDVARLLNVRGLRSSSNACSTEAPGYVGSTRSAQDPE